MSCATCSNANGGPPRGCRNNGHCSSGGCGKLEVYDWLAGVPLPGGQQVFDAAEVRFKNTRKAFYQAPPSMGLQPGELVVVDAGQGYDLGQVGLTGELARVQMQRKEGSMGTHELRRVLRKAEQEDIDRWHEARAKEDDTLFTGREVVRHSALEMKLTDVEYQGDGTKAIFYYTAEERIDFRGLVRQLSDQFRVKVEMKQIGARQEAGRIGGIGSCGRELCCSTWLTDLRSVTTSAARYQQLALNPQKLAGQCGKLKCCLNYELDMYIEAIKSYPSQNAKLRTKQGTGVHQKTDIFQGRMFYLFKSPGNPSIMAGFPVDYVRDILRQNKEGVEPEVDLEMAEETVEKSAHDYENVVGQDELTRFDQKMREKRGKRKRGGKKTSGGDRERTARKAPASKDGAGKDGAKGEGQRRRRSHGGRGRKGGGPPKPPAGT
ncbi:MAG: hypothetical protein H6595_06075 [Flavobacteriales bacterium]|nr:hypothetical protein [Flavobacteriales bacterium]MCB9167033.1 hypothetical protein [Flavobacteriales bacterium]